MYITFLKPFSAYPVSPMSAVDFVTGILNPRQEVLALLPVLKLTGKSTATAFAIADSDIDTLLFTFLQKERASWMGLGDAWNAVPDVARDVAAHALGGDYSQIDSQIRNAALLNATGGAAQTIYIPLAVPFQNIQKENPNLNAFSAGQLATSARVDLDVLNVGLPATVVLGNGSMSVTAVAAELWALTGAIRPNLWMAPGSKCFQRAASSVTIEAEGGPLLDEFAFSTVDAATFPNADDSVQITIDGKNYMIQTPTHALPFAYSATAKQTQNSLPFYDVSQNTKARAAAARKGRTPLIWIPGAANPIEAEWPAAASGRAINFGPKTSAAPTLVFWRQTPITSQENTAFLSVMMQDPKLQPFFAEKTLTPAEIQQIKMLQFGDLAVHGGGSSGPGAMNSDLSLFKPRIFAPARGNTRSP